MRRVQLILPWTNAAIVVLLMVCLNTTVIAQNTFRGVLLNKADSSAISFAAVHLVETNESVLATDNGSFEFTVPSGVKHITLNVSSIGCKATLTYHRPFANVEKIYLDVAANSLSDVRIKGLTAQEVVKKAVRMIPVNYADSSYVAYAMYRQYQLVNGHFKNLVEIAPATMFRLAKTKEGIESKEAFAVREFRRVAYDGNPSNVYEDNPADLLLENPVFHLLRNSLSPGKIDECDFNFDTTVKSSDYIIKYRCRRFCSESHGWFDRDYWYTFFHDEGYEEGRLVIDRETFAIRQYDRKATRRPDYIYNPFNAHNIVGGIHKYFMEFVHADVHAEYGQMQGKWYLTRLCHAYTDDFFDIELDSRRFTITDAFEWMTDSVSRYVTADIYSKFFYRPTEREGRYPYDKDFWDKANFPFYFFDKAAIYHDLEREGPIGQQFFSQSSSDITAK